MARGTRATAQGFTLIELVIVLAVLAVILAMVAPMAFQLFSAEQSSAVEEELQQIHRAIVGNPGRGQFGYVGDVGKYPASLIDLMVQPKDSLGVALPGWKGPYLRNPRAETGVLLDPFGRPFEYLLKDMAAGSGNVLAIISRGPDGVSTNTAENPNVAANYGVGAIPTDDNYRTTAQNADNVVYPIPSSVNALNYQVSGDVAFNILNFDANALVNAFVPACPQLFSVTATSLTRDTNDVLNLTYSPGVTFDLVQGQYQIKVIPQAQTAVSWTETVTVLPASTVTRTLNLTGLDSSVTPIFLLAVKNSFSNVKVNVVKFTTQLKGATTSTGSFNVTDQDAGTTLYYQLNGCAQVYIKQKGTTGPVGDKGIISQFVMPYGNSTSVVGAAAATLTVVNMVEKRLMVFRNQVLAATIPKGDVHDDEGKKDPHIKTKTFGDWLSGDVITIYSDNKDHSTTLLATVPLVAGAQTVTLQ